ncbi:hypothetical protein KFE25_005182 [Diacronema lutheri]|uniref:COPI associated protein n=2 Tax=Diacronema lutheri TaxID=2081491 RepID=A0A8J5XCQ7_DIALT|nr:hypothetical protein KFE25_005182 [Diacronema lutheri]
MATAGAASAATQPAAPSLLKQACSDPAATMSFLSLCSGVILFVGGLFGVININLLKAMTSVYSMAFGLVIVIAECKHVPLLSVLYRQLEFYAHFLVYPRGKAAFDVLVGVLTFFAHTEWGFSKIASLIVVVVGALHFLTSFCMKARPGEHASPDLRRATDAPDFRGDASREAFAFAQAHPETSRKAATTLFKASVR